jgi:hypothetical protein
MLLDLQRHGLDVDLLDHSGLDRQQGLQGMPALGARVEAMIEAPAVDHLRREGDSFVLAVTGLSTDVATLLALWRGRLGRLDDVRRGRLRRG